MIYEKFYETAVKQDSRNIFESMEESLPIAEQFGISDFYKDFNPIDVEFIYDGLPIVFIPANKLEEVKSQYGYVNPDIVFAQSNSDPIFLKNGAVYTCAHGVGMPKLEKLANSFEEYLNLLLQ